MLWVYDHYMFTLSVRGLTLDSESDVYRSQILTSKIDPRAERVKALCYIYHLNWSHARHDT